MTAPALPMPGRPRLPVGCAMVFTFALASALAMEVGSGNVSGVLVLLSPKCFRFFNCRYLLALVFSCPRSLNLYRLRLYS